MSRLLKSIAIVVVFIIALVVIATQVISTEDIVAQITEKTEQATGRKLTISGDTSINIYPAISVEMNNVSFANMPDQKRANMLTMEKLDVHIPWLAFLSGDLNVDKFVFVNPKIYLEKNGAGQVNWQFIGQNQEKPVSVNETESSDTINIPDAFDISLGQVEIVSGQIIYHDQQLNKQTVLEDVHFSISLPSLRKTLTIQGKAQYMDKDFELSADIKTPIKAIQGQPFDVGLNVESTLLTMVFNGNLITKSSKFSGKVNLTVPSVKDALKWQNINLDAKPAAFNQLQLTSDIVVNKNVIGLNDINLTLDQLDITGSSKITLADVPNLQAKVDLGMLDLTPYLANGSSEIANENNVSSTNNEMSPIVWDETKIDLSALSQANIDITLTSSGLIFNRIKLAKNVLSVKLANQNLKVNLDDFNAYQGSGTGSIEVNAVNKPYKIRTHFNLTNINAEPLLSDVANFDKVLGKGNISWSLSTTGQSQKEFIETLTGKVAFNIADGAVKGVNLGALARSAENALKGDFKAIDLDTDFNHSQKTDFASLDGVFNFKQGTANVDKLALVNPFIRTQGSGKVDLPAAKTSLKLKTKLVSSANGVEQAKESGITIPIKITGPFHKTKIRPDISGSAKDKVKEKVKDKLKKLFG